MKIKQTYITYKFNKILRHRYYTKEHVTYQWYLTVNDRVYVRHLQFNLSTVKEEWFKDMFKEYQYKILDDLIQYANKTGKHTKKG